MPCTEPGVLVTNPPYGERIGVRGDHRFEPDELAKEFFAAFSGTLKQRFAGWSVFLFTVDLSFAQTLCVSKNHARRHSSTVPWNAVYSVLTWWLGSIVVRLRSRRTQNKFVR